MANQYTKKKLINEKNRKEIFWNLVNSLLAGGLVFLGALINGGFSWQGLLVGLGAAGIVAVTKFKDYWQKEEGEYCKALFNFVG
jgi:hypothetical protein